MRLSHINSLGLFLIGVCGCSGPAPSYSAPADLKVGMSAADLSRLYPGHYWANPTGAKMTDAFKRFEVTLPVDKTKLETFSGDMFTLKMEGIWDKMLTISFIKGRITGIEARVEKCSVCD